MCTMLMSNIDTVYGFWTQMICADSAYHRSGSFHGKNNLRFKFSRLRSTLCVDASTLTACGANRLSYGNYWHQWLVTINTVFQICMTGKYQCWQIVWVSAVWGRRKEGGQGLTGMQSKQGFRQNICDLSVNNDIDQPLLLAHTPESVLTVQDCDQSWLPFSIYDLFQLSGFHTSWGGSRCMQRIHVHISAPLGSCKS